MYFFSLTPLLCQKSGEKNKLFHFVFCLNYLILMPTIRTCFRRFDQSISCLFNFSQKNLWLADTLMDIFQENRVWLEKFQFLLLSVVYTYLRNLSIHQLYTLINLFLFNWGVFGGEGARGLCPLLPEFFWGYCASQFSSALFPNPYFLVFL